MGKIGQLLRRQRNYSITAAVAEYSSPDRSSSQITFCNIALLDALSDRVSHFTCLINLSSPPDKLGLSWIVDELGNCSILNFLYSLIDHHQRN